MDRTEEERAKRLMAMGQMAASLAHEIRNPLGSMELYCSLLKKDLADSPSSFKLADSIHAGIRTLDRIISNCLQFSRDITPRIAPIPEPEALVSRTLEFAAQKGEASQLIIHTESLGSEPVQADSYLVQQALLNVVLNAIDAALESRSAEPMVRVVSDRREPGVWKLVVEDNGGGIPEEELERIFDPFVTTKQHGTGLGLAIVHSILAAHGGSIQLESTVGKGTRAILSLPGRTAVESAA